MMKETLKSYKSDNRGSAIITGLVVSTVLMVLCLSLLLVAYSFFISTYKSTSDLPNREMLYSAAEALEHELTEYTLEYEEGAEPALPADHALWNYVYNNIWQGFDPVAGKEGVYAQDESKGYWLYFDANDTSANHKDIEKCSRYFNLSSLGNVKIVVQLYWQLPNGTDLNAINRDNKNGTLLNAIYRMYDNKGNLLVKTSRKYIYNEKIIQNSSSEGSETETTTSTTLEFQVRKDFEIFNKNNIIVEFICHNNWNTGSNCQINITNNTGNIIKASDWYIIIKTNNTIVSDNGFKHELIGTDNGSYIYKMYNNDRSLDKGSNVSVISYNGGEPCEWVPILLQFNEIQNTSVIGSNSSSTMIKWNRIGEDIINPGGGN